MKTREEKIEYLRNASADKLMDLLVSYSKDNTWGERNEDIDLIRAEILRRMA